LGAESTGTTTLSRALAEYYKTTWVPEYGREYTYGKVTANKDGSTWNSQEFEFIAEMQNKQEDQFARYANKILICDTNSFATALWHERYINKWSIKVEELFKERNYDLYILTDTDIPFVQDGIRDGEYIRQNMHDRFIELLNEHNYPYIIVSGSLEKRLATAVKNCDELFNT
jgi:NadR type nicotinamide-nucleotide adenylyltransferase